MAKREWHISLIYTLPLKRDGTVWDKTRAVPFLYMRVTKVTHFLSIMFYCSKIEILGLVHIR